MEYGVKSLCFVVLIYVMEDCMASAQKEGEKSRNASVQKVQNEESAFELDLTELLYYVWDRKWLVVILAVLGTVVMVAYSYFFVTPQYRSQSVLYIGNNDNSMVSLSDLQIGASLTKDYIKVFEFWEVHEEVAGMIQKDPEIREMYGEKTNSKFTSGAVRGMFSISNPASTRLLYIQVTTDDPIVAAKIANAYAKAGQQIISKKMQIDEKSLPIISYARDGSNDQDKELSSARLKSVAGSKVAPKKSQNVIVGFFAGVLLALVIVVIQFLSNTKIKTENDIRKYVNLPVLAVVPVLRVDGEKKGKSGLLKKTLKRRNKEH